MWYKHFILCCVLHFLTLCLRKLIFGSLMALDALVNVNRRWRRGVWEIMFSLIMWLLDRYYHGINIWYFVAYFIFFQINLAALSKIRSIYKGLANLAHEALTFLLGVFTFEYKNIFKNIQLRKYTILRQKSS